MKNICTVTGCENPYLAKGFCSTHYHKNRKKQRRQLPCSIDACPNPLHQAGLCHSHYWRKYKHGDASAGGTRQGESLEWLRTVVRHCIAHDVDECVEQTYHNSEPGYGEVVYQGKRLRMHVVSLILSGQDAPQTGQVTRHLCANHRCVNPRHLRAGTQKENVADARKSDAWRNSTWRGERVNTAKLTEHDIRVIRNGNETPHVLAERFGVIPQTIRYVRERRTWRHLP